MTIDKTTFQFLKDLRKNNNRDWFAEHKNTYEQARANAKAVFAEVLEKLEMHDEIEKSKMMRIYRDVRFSKDKTPYKAHFSNSYSRLGASLRGGYFLQVRPGESFLAGGFWEPNKDDLFRLRKEIEQDASEIRGILKDNEFQKHFGDSFYSFSELKTAPRGFDKDHKDVDLLRKKGFIAMKKFTDKEVLSKDFTDNVNESFLALRPFFNLFSDILTTNLNGESIL
ncbi:DUF2461 domain-containing protein [Polaribacter sp. MED152]|uniref:DUF2461 domain-containing protein n=1 Tax=Polaribacter sp. MED152 TaxID=313598 RepID=UPI000068C612|nr:DUF2461 domain-containing protein [Polaribacter sp. MED152]EAQ41613.1 hypothetical protein MED152_02825 [Polaribacter sp. MED152]